MKQAAYNTTLSTTRRVAMYLKQANIGDAVGFVVKEKVLKAMESNPSIEYGMAAMHMALLNLVPELTLESHEERLVSPKIHRTSMSSQPWDRNYSRYVYQIRDSLKRLYTGWFSGKTPATPLLHNSR